MPAFGGHIHGTHASLVGDSQVSSFTEQIVNNFGVTGVGSSLKGCPIELV